MIISRKIALAAVMLTASASVLADKVTTYTLDPNHTQVHFSWSHAGFSNPGADFTQVTGTIQGNQDNPEKSSVQVVIPVKSLDSHVPLLNEHLLASGDYFKADEFPTVTFNSTGIRHINKSKRTFELLGDLTVNGITKPVVLSAHANTVGPHPFPIYGHADAAGFDATTRIKRSDFGMTKGIPIVGDELQVTITVEAIEAQAFQQAVDKMKAAVKN